MAKLSKRILSSFPVIIILIACAGAIYVQLESVLHPILYERFALNSPTFKDGVNKAKPLISALEMYKIEFQHYPVSVGDLPATKDLFLLIFIYKYEYEPYPSVEEPQEYMLSFRKRWSVHDVYCYYSRDGSWLQTSAPCWDTPRSMHGSRIPVKKHY